MLLVAVLRFLLLLPLLVYTTSTTPEEEYEKKLKKVVIPVYIETQENIIDFKWSPVESVNTVDDEVSLFCTLYRIGKPFCQMLLVKSHATMNESWFQRRPAHPLDINPSVSTVEDRRAESVENRLSVSEETCIEQSTLYPASDSIHTCSIVEIIKQPMGL